MYRIAKKKLAHMFWDDELPDDVIAQMLRLFGIGPIEVVSAVGQGFVWAKFPNGEHGAVPLKMLKPIESKRQHSACHLDS